MREILFRGKRADNGEWIYGYVTTQFRKYSEGILLTRIQSNTFGVGEHLVDTETVGQYTGIEDVNGTKVFEGDIVACEDGDGGYEYQDLIMRNGLICWGETGWCISNRQSITLDDMYIKNGKCDEIEVVGNIHDNPELLK